MTRHPFVLLLCLFLMRGSAVVQAAPPAPFVLTNGLRVVMRERHTSPLVAIDLWVRAGAREEGADEQGSAHFLEHMIFKGTKTRKAGDADYDMENLGASLDAATGPDAVHVSAVVLRSHLREALTILADVVRNATLPDSEVERERGVILDELAQHNADTSAVLRDWLYTQAFSIHPYRHSPGGTEAAIRARGRDTLAAFYQRAYAPERCTLALAGDLTPEDARTEALHTFGNWPRGKMAATSLTGTDAPSANAPISRFKMTHPFRAPSPSPQAALGLAFPAPPGRDAVTACAAQIAAVLLEDHLNDDKRTDSARLGADVSVRYTPRWDASLFALSLILPTSLSAQSQESSLRFRALQTSLLRALQNFTAAPLADDDLLAAKQRVLGQMQASQETNTGLAYALGYADITGSDAPERFRLRLQQVTAADVQQFFRTYLTPDSAIAVQLLPEEAK